mgnify:CR=1 FL=1
MVCVRKTDTSEITESVWGQIETGETATTYEPYCGGIPSPNPNFPQTIHTVNGNNNIKIENKNLLNLVDASGTTNGINYTVSNQKITLNGTGTSGRYPWLIFTRAGTYTQNGTPSTSSILDKANGTYWSIGQVARLINYISGTATANLAINLYDETGTQNNTPTSTTKIIAIAIYLGASQTYTNYTFNVQLEYGSTATTYVAHQEQNLPLDLRSKNLLDIEYYENGTIDIQTSQDLDNSKNGRGSNYIPVLPNTTYTISANTSLYNLRLSEYENDKTHIQS